MTVIHKLWKLFLYAGVEKEEYQKLLPQIRRKNLELLKLFSWLGAAMFFLLFAASKITQGFAAVNSTIYLVCGAAMLLIQLYSRLVLPKSPAIVTLFVHLFEITLYAFGIYVSMLHAEKPAVSAVAFLLVSPLLFYDRPIRLSAMIAATAAIFCGIVSAYKDPSVAESDIWNVITFGVLAVATTLFIMSIKIRALSQSGQIEYMSQTDLLTGAKNRNHYENQIRKYPGMCKTNVICIYADVNGLHEMNNSKGHPAGDRMLREVAEAMQQRFGADHTYRIGGDEFVAVRVDADPESLKTEIRQLQRDMSRKGYHVSFGTAIGEKAQGGISMHGLVNEAEINMFADKREYYRHIGRDRRSR
ncbi:MAG: diguanylate cyclase [Clostridia bacterium]|nr:diguanylate cyclase [Clostridia bacterium]